MQDGQGAAVQLHVPVDGGDDSLRQGTPQLNAQRVADGIDRIAYHRQLAVAKFGHREILRLHQLQHGDILVSVIAHQLGVVIHAVGQHHPAGGAAGDHMGVGNNIAVGAHDHAGTHRGALTLFGHHQYGGGIHLGIDLLRRQFLAVAGGNGQLPRRVVIGVPRDGSRAVRENVDDAAGIIVIRLRFLRLAALAKYRGQHQHHDHQHHDAKENPKARALSGRFGRCGPHAFRQRLVMDVVIHHLRPLSGNVPIHHLLRFVSVSHFIHCLFPFRCYEATSAAA